MGGCWMPHCSPSFRRGITSAAFQASGNVEVAREQFIISVSGPRITDKLSFNTRASTLSGPGDLFVGIAEIIRRTSSTDTDRKFKRSH